MELHDNVKITLVKPSTSATGGTYTTDAVDMANFGKVEFILQTNVLTATTQVLTPEVQEGSTSTTTGAVADADLLGTEAGATISGAYASGTVSKIGYKGNSRYVRLSVGTAVATGTISVIAIQSEPRVAPQT